MRDKALSEREVGAQLINETVAFAESGVCRRKILLNYFGEAYTQDNCGACDNCLHPKEKVEAKENVQKVLKVIKALDERFAVDYVVNMLLGQLTPNIKLYKHNNLPEFGLGSDEPDHYWNSLIRQMLLDNLLSKIGRAHV